MERIQEKLKRLRQRDTTYQVFGAKQHGYRLNSCLSPEQIDALEQHYHLSFPEEYRLFLQYMGNGGAGPYYGIYPIEQALQETLWDLLYDYDRATDLPNYFQQPFVPPSSVKMTEEQGTHSSSGLLRIAHEGCGGYYYLVVSGVECGSVWSDWEDRWLGPAYGRTTFSRALIPPHVWNYIDGKRNAQFIQYVLSPSYLHRLTFFQWYEDWLDSQLS